MWTPLNNLKVLQCPSIITQEKHGFTQTSLKSKPLNKAINLTLTVNMAVLIVPLTLHTCLFMGFFV